MGNESFKNSLLTQKLPSNKNTVFYVEGGQAMKKTSILLFMFIGLSFLSAPLAIAQETYKIGAAFALSGAIAVYGEGFKKAVDLAVEEINTAGGIKGKKIEIVYEDNKSTPKDCVTAVRKLIAVDKVPVLFGPAGSSNFMAAAPVAQESKVVMLSAHSEDVYVQEATKSGATGYLIKQACVDGVCGAIREVQKGHTCYSPSIPRRLHKRNGKKEME